LRERLSKHFSAHTGTEQIATNALQSHGTSTYACL
jgi:hypothetical protein